MNYAFLTLSLYLTGCRNVMTDVEYNDVELDNAVNMRAIIAKLLYNLRERWRSVICSIQDREKRRTMFWNNRR